MRRLGHDEAGTVSAFVASFAVALVAVAGLVVDGGYMLAGRRAAFDEAEAAARAGAQAVDESSLRLGGPPVVDPEAAHDRVADYMRITGHNATIEVAGESVTVDVRIDQQLTILGLFGVGPVTIRARGTARAVEAVQEADIE